MDKIINAKKLRASLPEVVQSVRNGARFTIVYRSRPAFRIVPVDEPLQTTNLQQESLYKAKAVGRSSDGGSSRDHDRILYGR